MKRSIVFILVLVLVASFLTGAYQTITGYGDDVTITPEHIYGDPKRVEGITTELRTTCDNHMLWYTRHTAGDPGRTETEYIFDQESIHEHDWEIRDEFQFHVAGGFGMSTSGGSIDVSGDGWGKVVRELAGTIGNGQTLEKEILLEDYFDYYPMDYYCSVRTPMYFVDEWHDTANGDSYDSGSYGRWNKEFKFPVVPGTKGHVTVTKNGVGNIVELSVQVYDVGDAGLTTCVWDEGMYFAPVYTNFEGQPLTNGEYVLGYGLYHIPFKADPSVEFHSEDTMYAGLFDHNNMELIYPMEPDDLVVAMAADDNGRLHLIVREDGIFRYCALDVAERTVTHRIDLMEAGEESWLNYKFFLYEGLLYLKYQDQIALLDIREEPSLEFILSKPEEFDMSMPTAACYRDGTLYLAALEWVEREDDTGLKYRSMKANYLAALDADGFGYFGYYYSDLTDNGHSFAYVSQDDISFVE